MKYAIMIPFGIDKSTKEPTDWIYLTDLKSDDFSVKLFDNLSDAEKHAEAWRTHKIVEYNG